MENKNFWPKFWSRTEDILASMAVSILLFACAIFWYVLFFSLCFIVLRFIADTVILSFSISGDGIKYAIWWLVLILSIMISARMYAGKSEEKLLSRVFEKLKRIIDKNKKYRESSG